MTTWIFIVFLYLPCVLGGKELWCNNDASTESLTPIIEDASSKDEIFTVNDRIRLYCCFTSKQPVQIKWYKDDIPPKIGAKYQFKESNQVFFITNGSKLDNGAYRCEGSNQYGRQSWNITVSIRLPPCYQIPTVYSPQTNVTVKQGTNVTLICIIKLEKDCRARSRVLYWRNSQGRIVVKNTNTLTSAGRSKNVLMKITIKDARKSQTGTYKCIVRNARSRSSSRVSLNVQ